MYDLVMFLSLHFGALLLLTRNTKNSTHKIIRPGIAHYLRSCGKMYDFEPLDLDDDDDDEA